jgi:hypothetical protein
MSRTRGQALVAGAAAVVIAATAVTLALVLLRPGPGPVTTLMNGDQPVVTSGGHPVRPNQQAAFTAYLFNTARDGATLVSAALVPVHGQPAGRLTHVSVYLNHSYDVADALSSWPPHGLDVRPLAGSVIGHGQAGILVGFTGPASGRSYTMAAGIAVTYRWQDRTYTVTAWSAGVACGDQLSSDRCTQLTDQVQDLTIQQAGKG